MSQCWRALNNALKAQLQVYHQLGITVITLSIRPLFNNYDLKKVELMGLKKYRVVKMVELLEITGGGL